MFFPGKLIGELPQQSADEKDPLSLLVEGRPNGCGPHLEKTPRVDETEQKTFPLT